jgi:tetratricopeptide (TPR) repeat protein
MRTLIAGCVLLIAGTIASASFSPARAWAKADVEACAGRDQDAAITACSRLLKDRRKIPASLVEMVLVARANAYSFKERYDEALSDCHEAIQIKPDHAFAYQTRAYAYQGKHDYDRAIRDYDQAIQLDPGVALVYLDRGIVYLNKGELDRAIDDLDRGLRLAPDLVAGYSRRGIAYLRKGDDERAIRDFDEAIRRDPKPAEAYYYRATIYQRNPTDFDRAIADFNEAIRLDPKSGLFYNDRGNAYLKKGDSDRAIADFNEAIRLAPDSAYAYDSRGEAYLDKKDYARAVIDLTEALRLDPNHTASYVNRGLAYENMGDLARARADYGSALARPAEPSVETNKVLDKARRRVAALSVRPPEGASAQAASGAPISKATAPVADPGTRVALVIGNGAYRKVPALTNPPRDAAAVAAGLRRSGFQTVIVQNDLPKEALEAALREFARAAENSDWALVYYAGHGLEMSGVNYLVPIDAKLETDRDVAFEAVPLDHVLRAVEGAKKLRLVMLDACRDNPFASQMRRTTASRSIGRGLAAVEPQTGSLVVFAAKDGETALDGDTDANSPFVAAFLRELSVPGIEIRKLFDLVRDDVLDATDNKQQPFTYGSLPGRQDFYFTAK